MTFMVAVRPVSWPGAGVGDDGDGEMRRTANHDAAVLKKEGAAAAVESAGNAFDGDINAGTFDGGAAGEHFALSGGVEIAVILLVDRHTAKRVVFGLESGIKRSDLDIEGSGGASGHQPFLLW
jgi:hypothetical protein